MLERGQPLWKDWEGLWSVVKLGGRGYSETMIWRRSGGRACRCKVQGEDRKSLEQRSHPWHGGKAQQNQNVEQGEG